MLKAKPLYPFTDTVYLKHFGFGHSTNFLIICKKLEELLFSFFELSHLLQDSAGPLGRNLVSGQAVALKRVPAELADMFYPAGILPR